MTYARPRKLGIFARVWQWLKDQWIREVPEDLALCEFDCRKAQCFDGDGTLASGASPMPVVN